MSKKKVSLSNRKRLNELQEHAADASKTIAEIRREQLQSMREMHVIPESQLELAIEQMIADVVLELTHQYQGWCQPLDYNRFRYSPNERNKMLLQSLKSYLMEVVDWLISKGIRGEECQEKCQLIVDQIADELRKSGVPIGQLHLRKPKTEAKNVF